MLICHCKRVSDRDIRTAIREGARNAESVGEACGAGTCCGGCRPAIDELIEERKRPSLPMLTAAIVGG